MISYACSSTRNISCLWGKAIDSFAIGKVADCFLVLSKCMTLDKLVFMHHTLVFFSILFYLILFQFNFDIECVFEILLLQNATNHSMHWRNFKVIVINYSNNNQEFVMQKRYSSTNAAPKCHHNSKKTQEGHRFILFKRYTHTYSYLLEISSFPNIMLNGSQHLN